MNIVAVGLIGLLSGVIGGLFGVGGGIVMVPMMILLLKLDPKMAVGTSLAVVVFISLVGASKHQFMGQVNWKVVLLFAPLAMIGSYIGAKLTGPISAEHLKRGFGGFLILVGVYMSFFSK